VVRSPEKSEKHEQNTQRENTHKTQRESTIKTHSDKHTHQAQRKNTHKTHSEQTRTQKTQRKCTQKHTKNTVENTKLKARIKSEKSTTELGSTHPIHFFAPSFQSRKQTRARKKDGGSTKSNTPRRNQAASLSPHTQRLALMS
jgi:hypothetical protein